MKKLFASLVLSMYVCAPAVAAEKIIVAANPTWPPMEFVDLEKNMIGYDIDITAAIAEELDIEIEYLNTAWDGIFATLDSKQSDILASSVTITDQRKKRYLFSEPYYKVRQSLIVPEASTLSSMEDLEGKTIGIQIGTSAGFALNKAGVNMTIKNYDDIGLVFEDLKNGRLDGAMCDDPVGRYYANRKEGFADSMKVAFVTDESEDIGFVFRKSDEELANKVNKAMEALRANGKEAEIRAKWFGAE